LEIHKFAQFKQNNETELNKNNDYEDQIEYKKLTMT